MKWKRNKIPFTLFKLSTYHTGVFTYQPKDRDWIVSPESSYSKRIDDKE